MNDPFVVLMRLWKAPSERDRLRGLGGIFGGFRRLPVFLFLVVEELLIGSNPGCILGLWASHYIPIKFSTIPAFIVAWGVRGILDHGRCIVNVRTKGLVPISLMLVVFVCLVSKREDKFAGIHIVIHGKLRWGGAWKECLMVPGASAQGHFLESAAFDTQQFCERKH